MSTWEIVVLVVLFVGGLIHGSHDSHQRQVIKWCDAREAFFVKILTEAQVVRSVPVHKSFRELADGNVTYEGQMINFAALKEMTFLMVNQEQARQLAGVRLGKAVDALTIWEDANPVPRWRFKLPAQRP